MTTNMIFSWGIKRDITPIDEYNSTIITIKGDPISKPQTNACPSVRASVRVISPVSKACPAGKIL